MGMHGQSMIERKTNNTLNSLTGALIILLPGRQQLAA